jgi:hypothetical protein
MKTLNKSIRTTNHPFVLFVLYASAVITDEMRTYIEKLKTDRRRRSNKSVGANRVMNGAGSPPTDTCNGSPRCGAIDDDIPEFCATRAVIHVYEHWG